LERAYYPLAFKKDFKILQMKNLYLSWRRPFGYRLQYLKEKKPVVVGGVRESVKIVLSIHLFTTSPVFAEVSWAVMSRREG